MKKKQGTGAIGYMLLFGMALVMIIIVMYMMQMAKIITHHQDVDDALADSVLASLVADDVYYFRTAETTGTPVVRFRDVDESHGNYVDCMNAAVSNTEDFYYNFVFDQFVLYEVEGNNVKATAYTGNGGVKSVVRGTLGNVRTPQGDVVLETSAYGRVKFDIQSILDGSYITKTREIYCTLEIN